MIKRKGSELILKTLQNKQIPIIMGLRRVGKTTILKQLSEKLGNCLIINCDKIKFTSLTSEEFYNYVVSNVYKFKYIFLDEIQVIKNWDILLKNLFDEFVEEEKCNFIATGSSSMILDAKELGVNRTKRIVLETWDFNEFSQLTKQEKNIENFEDYFGHGISPLYFDKQKSFSEILEESLKPIIFNDISRAFPGVDSQNVLRTFKELANYPTGEVNETNLSKKLGISVLSIRKYIPILEKALLLKKIEPIRADGSFPRKKNYKVFLNPHFQVLFLNKKFSALENNFKGHIIESYWLHWAKSINGYFKEFYYLKGDKEVDFVSLNPDGSFKTLHEFKYQNKVYFEDVKHLLKHKSTNKIIWTKNPEDITGFKNISILDIEDN